MFGTEVLKHYLSQSPLPQAVLNQYYPKISPYFPGCTSNRGVKLVGPNDNGYGLLNGLYGASIPAVLVEGAFITNQCQWNVVYTEWQKIPAFNPFGPPDPRGSQYLTDAAIGIKLGIMTCLVPSEGRYCLPR